MRHAAVPPNSSWALPLRVLLAVGGGYGLTSLVTILLSLLLPLPPAESVLAASLCSFAIYTAIIIWVFACPSLNRVWRGLCWSVALLGAVCLLLAGLGGGR